jgi:glucose/arabinose dehydrogenase
MLKFLHGRRIRPGRSALQVTAGLLVGVALTLVLQSKVASLWHRASAKLERVLAGWSGPDASGAAAWAGRGHEVGSLVAGLDFPVRLVARPDPEGSGRDLGYYVAELPGTIKWVRPTGATQVVATDLLDFEWRAGLEIGLMGLDAAPDGRTLFATFGYWDGAAGVYRNKVERLMLDGGEEPRLAARHVIFDPRSEATVASYCVQFISLGPDGHLYVGIGAGGRKTDAQDLSLYAGKILRMDIEGRPLSDNPFFDPARPDTPTNFIYAFGMRNPFDITWTSEGVGIVSDVGPGIDRILRLEPGVNYCFGGAGGEEDMRANALYTWGPGGHFAPTGVQYVDDAEGGPALYVGMFGAVQTPGSDGGKRVVRFHCRADGKLTSGAELAVQYAGVFFAGVTDLLLRGEDLLFLDFYGPSDAPFSGKGSVYGLRATGPGPEPDQSGMSGGALFEVYGCVACHDLTEPSAKEGPSLAGLRDRLLDRLSSAEYVAKLAGLEVDEAEFFRAQRGRYLELRSAAPAERPRIWFRHHVHNPRFDHPESKMPGYEQIPAGELERLADFLLGDD